MSRLLALCLVLLFAVTFGAVADDSQCVSCHTSARSLITVSREIEAELPDQPTESTESVGEG